MIAVLDSDRTRDEACDVILEADASHELVKPGPHLETVKLSQQSGVMKSDPTASALFDVLDERGLRLSGPIVRRIIQLDEQVVLCEESVVDLLGIFDVVHGEIVFARQLVKPSLCRIHERFVDAAVFGKCDHMESSGLIM